MAIFTGIAGLIGGAVSAVSGFIGALGAAGSFLLKTAVGIGLNLLAQAIAGKPKDPTFSINGTLQAGGDIPRSFIVGRTMTAGSLVWVNTWGKDGDTPNAYLTQVIALSDLPIKGVDEFWVNGENTGMDMSELVTSEGDGNAAGLKASIIVKAFFAMRWGLHKDLIQYLPGGVVPASLPAFTTAVNSSGHLDKFEDRFGGEKPVVALGPFDLFDAMSSVILQLGRIPKQNARNEEMGVPVRAYRKDGVDHMWVRFYDGTQTGPDPLLVGKASNSQRQWDSNRIGKGVAYAVITCRNKKNMFSGIPNFKFVVNGIPLYDPSKDSTVGGVGDHRWSQPETWGGDGDYLPAVQAYNLLRGIEYNGQWFYGLQGMTAARLPVANWIAQINKCRADDDKYQCSGEINIDAPLATALEAVLTTCQGRISEVGGIYNIYLGAPDTPVASFTDDDILSTEEQSFTPFFGLSDTINGIAATYPDPDDGWNMKAAPPLYRTDLEVLAGNRRLMADVEMTFVPNAEQVQRLMKSALLEGQRARRHTLVLPPAYWPYAVPGAILSWTSERNGYVNKLFRVDGAVDRANLDVMIDITEVDPADYDWDPDTDYQVPVDGTVGPPMRPQPQPIVDWYAEGSEIKDADGRGRRAAILLTWDNTPDRLDDVIGIEYEVVLDADLSEVTNGRTDMPEVGRLYVSHSILPATRYRVRGRYIPGGERDTLWSGWLLVDTPDIRITDVTAYLEGVGEDVYRTLQELRAEQAELRDRLEILAAGTADATGASSEMHAVTRKFRNATAIALREMTASIEAKTQVYRQPSPPTGDLVDGDIWIDTSADNFVRVWNATLGQWEDAGAKGLLTFAQPTAPTASNVGDLWIDTDDENKLYRWSGTAWVDISDERITAQASILDAVQAQVGEISADGLRKIEVVAGTGDVVARLVDMVRASIADDWVEAGTVTEVGFEGGDPAKPFSRRVQYADQHVFADANGEWPPVVIDETGTGWFNRLRIKDLDATNIKAKSLDADAVLQGGTLVTEIMAFSAVTSGGSDSGAVDGNALRADFGNYVPIAQVEIDNLNPNPVFINYTLNVSAAIGSTNSNDRAIARIRLRRSFDDSVVDTVLASAAGNSSGGTVSNQTSGNIMRIDPVITQGAYSYVIEAAYTRADRPWPSSDAAASGEISLLYWKR